MGFVRLDTCGGHKDEVSLPIIVINLNGTALSNRRASDTNRVADRSRAQDLRRDQF